MNNQQKPNYGFKKGKCFNGIERINLHDTVKNITTSTDNLYMEAVVDGVLECSAKIGIKIEIDEDKIKKWINMCVELERVPDEWRQRWGCAEKMWELEKEILILTDKLEKAKENNNE